MRHGATLMLLTCASLAVIPAARAQEIDWIPADENRPLSPEETTVLAEALATDGLDYANRAPGKSLRLPSLARPSSAIDVSRNANADGSSTMVMKKALPIDWDTKVGADVGYAAKPATVGLPDTALSAGSDGPTAGAAWASVGVADLATVDTRVATANEQGTLATTFKKSIPVGSKLSVTLQNSYALTETFGTQDVRGDVPLAVSSASATQWTPQTWSTAKAAKLDILPTGTSLAASVANTTTDPVTHHSISADQKLLGPLHVTTAMNDIGLSTSSKSITAGFKLNW